jgi:hypothetical protein
MMTSARRPATLLALALGACTDAPKPVGIDRRERGRAGEGGRCA